MIVIAVDILKEEIARVENPAVTEDGHKGFQAGLETALRIINEYSNDQPETKPMARHNDPETAKVGAKKATTSVKKQVHEFLVQNKGTAFSYIEIREALKLNSSSFERRLRDLETEGLVNSRSRQTGEVEFWI